MLEDLSINVIIPVLVTLIGFISYFFGKIISETYTGIEENSQNYIYGFMFVLVYFALPLSIIYYFRETLLFNLNIYTGMLFFVLLSSIIKFVDIKQKGIVVAKGQAYEEFEKEALKRTNLILKKFKISSDNNYITNVFRFAFTGIPSNTTMLVLTFLEIFFVVNLIYSSNIILGVIFLILFIGNMSNIAQLSVARGINYPDVVVEDNNGNKYSGRIIKFGKEFVSIRDKRDVYNFSRENIKYVLAKEKLSLGNTTSKNVENKQQDKEKSKK